MAIKLSVLLCTHQPNPNRFQRVLEALEKQSLASDLWDLVVVDNNSNPPLELPAWSRGRVVREPRLGIAAARSCAFRSSQGELGVFVDDDNVLDCNYLQSCLEIAEQYPFLGCWGGSAIPEFEAPPLPEMAPYLELLALRQVTHIAWSNRSQFPIDAQVPFGAGMCLRRSVMDFHTAQMESAAWHYELGRTPTSMLPCEDTDLVFSACDAGLGYGVFPQLSLVHLIPKNRTQADYLLRVLESSSEGHYLLKHWRGQKAAVSKPGWRGRLLDRLEKALTPWLSFRLRARLAQRRGQRRAFERIYAEDRQPTTATQSYTRTAPASSAEREPALQA